MACLKSPLFDACFGLEADARFTMLECLVWAVLMFSLDPKKTMKYLQFG